MLTSETIAGIMEKQAEFLSTRIAAMNLFQFDLCKPRFYLWYWYKKGTCCHLPPFERAGGNAPALRLPWMHIAQF